MLIQIKKKSQTTRYEEHRTISLIMLVLKFIIDIEINRIETKANVYLRLDQFKFRKGVGTGWAVAAMRLLSGQSIDQCVVDYERPSTKLTGGYSWNL